MEQGRRMLKRRRSEGDDGRRGQDQQQRLYLIFDDWAWGYSIRKINLQSLRSCPRQRTSPRQKTSLSASGTAATMRRRLLPRPFIQLEALRGDPFSFAAVGTKIVATHYSTKKTGCCDECTTMPIVDVRSRGVNSGPGQMYHCTPIYITVGDRLFSLDIAYFMVLSFEPLRAPRVGDFQSMYLEPRWVWHYMPVLPFDRSDITSYTLHSDGHTILVSTGEATYALDTSKLSIKTVRAHEYGLGFIPKNQDTGDVVPIDTASDMGQDMWKRLGEWSLPFTGRAHFVHCLDAFVGLSKDPATVGHLCCCEAVAVTVTGVDGGPPAPKLSKEKLFSEDPAETHVGATLLYTGGAEFCLVQCVSIEKGKTIDPEEVEELDEQQECTRKEGASTVDQEQLKKTQGCRSYIYRLTTFSLCYDDNGDLSTADTCRAQCYEVPEETTEEFLRVDPVAFWL